MKTNKPKRYQYNSQLIDSWLTDKLPPEGGCYTGSSAYLECDSRHFWAGRDHGLLLAVQHPKAVLMLPVSDIPLTGAACDSCRMVAGSFTSTRGVQYFVPPSERENRYRPTRKEERMPVGKPTLLVPHLTEDMKDRSLESLLPSVLAYYNRNFQRHFAAAKQGVSSSLTGYYDWRAARSRSDEHMWAVDHVRRVFTTLGLPFQEEWSQMALLRTAKKRLAA